MAFPFDMVMVSFGNAFGYVIFTKLLADGLMCFISAACRIVASQDRRFYCGM